MSDCKRFNPVRREDEEIRQESLSGERALYKGRRLKIYDTVFHDGESPLKESADIELARCEFQWKYPVWYSNNISINSCVWNTTARSGVWYTNHMTVDDSMVGAPKNFRRCHDLTIRNTSIPDAQETLWSCDSVTLDHVTAKGDYFGMNSSNIKASHLELLGNYAFDGAHNVEIRSSRLITKDCFWNCENVTVYDSYISGEYLAWNTQNLTLVNCTIESDQGLCYIRHLKMTGCRLINTKLAFELSEDIDAYVISQVDSILNPGSGKITVRELDELIIEPDNCDCTRTLIQVRDNNETRTIRLCSAV
ncbi:MAG: DUF3737 family protein [Saccharofermentans sp.]|jgi:hypothetical protein|nr:DUF3737 family protein [Mageeibacillus sp.]MCI1263765.1 DUF3737 family protein [Saccharofermentans sp.]MCI1274769.1 DUF3737 family protein [Saccharofermentans sp.]MCI1769199.1 DUF3737 family protein [Mageeibacillus sp.]MCI2044738.1 DUF3737 family protein [Mageeibacillus sp.]